MILIELKEYLKTRQTANLEQIARYFDQDPALIRTMLSHWIRKGQVVRMANPPGCGKSCQQCQPETAEVYQFVDLLFSRSASG